MPRGQRGPTPTPPPVTRVDTASLPHVGDTIGGHCRLRALLGEGAFGRVFAAEHVETQQQLALKIVGLNRYPREYAEHELRALAAIAHPNVVQLNEYGVEGDAVEPYLWYTMPLYRGEDLARLIAERGPLSLRAAHAVFVRIAGGVCEMHDSGLRHQDIKPENVYLAEMTGVEERHPVLLDLGGAAREGSARPLIATLGFAAPEQTRALLGGQLGERAGAPLSAKIDVYALATTLLYALLGREFAGYDVGQRDADDVESRAGLEKLRRELAEVHTARAEEPLPETAFSELTRTARRRLSDAFRRWLSPDPDERPDARGLVRELGVLLEWDEELARAEVRRQKRRAVTIVTAGSVVAAGLGGWAGYEWHHYAMTRANQATLAAQRGRDRAAEALRRADEVLDGIVADEALSPAEKARKIGVVLDSLRAQASTLLGSNQTLQAKLDELARAKESAEQSRERAARERKSALDAKAAAEMERDAAVVNERAAEDAKARADAERERAVVERLLAESAKARAETEREQALAEKRSAEEARGAARAERDRAVSEKLAAESARARVEAERDEARAERKAAEETAFANGFAAGAASGKKPDPAPGAPSP